jgi:hypothetical protein
MLVRNEPLIANPGEQYRESRGRGRYHLPMLDM